VTNWPLEIERLHLIRPGITEAVLKAASWRNISPYQWLTEGVDPSALVVDLGCGSAPTAQFLGSHWIGVDLSEAELKVAQRNNHGCLIKGDMRQLPVTSGCADVVVSSMSLMLVDPVDSVLKEIVRVLKPGGELRIIVPTSRGLTARDRFRYFRLLRILHLKRLFPPFESDRDLTVLLAQNGFKIEIDESARFQFDLHQRPDGELLIESLYLPSVLPRNRERAVRMAYSWCGSDLGISLRRIVCHSTK
jgi:SAM-dependent methyltransferase